MTVGNPECWRRSHDVINEKTTASRQVWDTFRRALENSVATDSRLRFSALGPDVVEITNGQNRLLVSLERNTNKTTLHFPSPDHDQPNFIRVSLNPEDTQPCQIGGRSLSPAGAAREVIETFVTK
jgi:hypothetical protein